MSQSGSVPTRLGVSNDTFNDRDENVERKRFLENEIGGLLKQKSRLIEDNGKLVKSAQDLQESLKQLRERMAREREEQKKLLQDEKAKALEELAIKERELSGKEDELETELGCLIDIYEYLVDLSDELVWWSSHNADLAAKIDIEHTYIRRRNWELDDKLDEALKLTERLKLTSETANNEILAQSQLSSIRSRKIKEELDKAEGLRKSLEQNKVELDAKLDDLRQKEERLGLREKELRDREETLKRSLQSRV